MVDAYPLWVMGQSQNIEGASLFVLGYHWLP